MVNPFRQEMKSTGAAKGSKMGVTNEFMPARASKLSGQPNQATKGPPADQTANQAPEDKQGAGYKNDASGWVRGAGENATQKPGFDKHRAGR